MKQREALTTAVIVSFEARELLPGAMESLRPVHDAGELECIVVDNASSDGTVEYLRREHPWTRVIESKANLGFGRACNLGLQSVSTPYVLLLNPDAEIDPEDLSTLVRFLEDNPTASAAAPAIRNADGSLQFTQPLPTPRRMLAASLGLRRTTAIPIEPGAAPFRTEWLCGAVLLLRSRLLRQLGGFDPRFFLYFEETDLCRRAAQEGAELWAVGEAVARHRVGAVARRTEAALYNGCVARHYFESRFYYLVKHFGWAWATATELTEVLSMALRALLAGLRRRQHSDFHTRLQAPFLSLPPPPSSRAARP